ncbi:DUF4192 domain-containing protein [Nocardioides sp. CER19]|uniref:DUF4192 domain-containing protein n=1 Tax=Nocardioides sp. CER19 TaxID=3038538 RepID=UPI0024496968|nr:DUF4192 domain-containing protein [Nocardioides sp. CER19]MDH2416615.1 DUF4192 domain-containing protein [Nocardioides sp. CER19]
MTTFTARSTEDVLALVPVVIGFEPHESVVMLTFGGRESFHARIDLPAPDDIAGCVESLLEPVRRHAVRQVVFVLFSGQDRLTHKVARALQRRFDAAGVRVIDAIRAHDGRWFTPLGRSGVPAHGVPYDVTDHPFRAQAIFEGRVMAGSREELSERLRADPDAVAAVEDALGDLWEGLPVEVQLALETTAHADEAFALLGRVRPDGRALRAMLDRHLAADTVPDDLEAARILLAVHNAEIRDHAWLGITRAEALGHVRLWTDLVRRAPDGLVAGAAAVLAFASWMHGDGALAWCAVDRCLEDDPDHSLGRIVADALEGAVPPHEDWTARFPGGLAG